MQFNHRKHWWSGTSQFVYHRSDRLTPLLTDVSADFFLTARLKCGAQTQDLENMQRKFAPVLSVSSCSSYTLFEWEHGVTHSWRIMHYVYKICRNIIHLLKWIKNIFKKCLVIFGPCAVKGIPWVLLTWAQCFSLWSLVWVKMDIFTVLNMLERLISPMCTFFWSFLKQRL